MLESPFSDNSASDYPPPTFARLSPFSSMSSASSCQGGAVKYFLSIRQSARDTVTVDVNLCIVTWRENILHKFRPNSHCSPQVCSPWSWVVGSFLLAAPLRPGSPPGWGTSRYNKGNYYVSKEYFTCNNTTTSSMQSGDCCILANKSVWKWLQSKICSEGDKIY